MEALHVVRKVAQVQEAVVVHLGGDAHAARGARRREEPRRGAPPVEALDGGHAGVRRVLEPEDVAVLLRLRVEGEQLPRLQPHSPD